MADYQKLFSKRRRSTSSNKQIDRSSANIPPTIQGMDHVQVNWKHKSIGNISQLNTRPLIGWSSGSTNRAGSGQNQTRNLARGPRFLSGPTWPGPDFGWPNPARTSKIALLAKKFVKNRQKCAKKGQKLAARSGLWPKYASPNLTRAKTRGLKPDPHHEKSGPTQPYQPIRGLVSIWLMFPIDFYASNQTCTAQRARMSQFGELPD